MQTANKLAIAGCAAAAVIFVLTGAIVYKSHKKSQDQTAIVTAVADTTLMLREVLGPGAADAAGRIDAHLQMIKGVSRSPLADAAEDYVLGAREIAKRRAEAARFSRQAAAARQAVHAHLAAGGRRNEAWFRTAGELKKRMETEHFNLGVALKALDGLLFGMAESIKRTAPLVGDKLVVDQALLNASRQQAAEELKRATAELERARQLPLS